MDSPTPGRRLLLLSASPDATQAPPSPDRRRRQNLAGLQPQGRDFSEGALPEAGSLAPIGPEGMPGLLSASMDESGSSGQGPSPMGMPSVPSSSSSPSGASRFEGNSPGQSISSSPTASDAGFGNWNTRPGSQLQLPSPQAEDDHPVIRRRVNPYAGVPSLYDLYAQVSRRSPVLARFGEEIFRNGTGNFDEFPMDLPVGPDYVLGPGDGLSIEVWGGISQHLQRVVDREGRVALPEAGAVEVTGAQSG